MKKILFGAIALLGVASISSCDKCGDKGACTNDSLSVAYGNYVGTVVNSEITQYGGVENLDKDAFLKGFQTICASNADNKNMLMGMQVGMQLMNELNQLKENGIEIDRDVVINNFKKAFKVDSVNTVEVAKATTEFRRLMTEAQEAAQEAEAKKKAEAPDAVANVEAGNKAVEALKAENSAAKTTDSGLTYVIETEGAAPTPDANATVVVNYSGKHLNGEVFDSTDGRGPATFNLQGVVPGFREGLMLLGKGGKATLYIPGELAYGINGQPQAGIGPNEMLVFDVELLDINPAK